MDRNILVMKKGRHAQGMLYDTALNEAAYGRPQMVGDLFGDVMSAVVGKENWNARPQWMKNIKVKPNPATLMKAVPPKLVGTVARRAEQYGINTYYRTPYGDQYISPDMAEGAYSNFPAFSRAMSGFSSIPTWVYLLGGAGAVLFIVSMRKK